MEQDDRLLNAMFEMCNHKNPLNDGQREWHIADISGLLREERYDELDERYNQALMESLPAAKRKSAILRLESNGQPFLRYGHAG